jgi:hypothetical protein
MFAVTVVTTYREYLSVVQVEEGAGAQEEAGGDQPGGDQGADC